MKIVMTGGHHTSAVPIIQELKKYPDIRIEWFGALNSLKGDKNIGLEYQEITGLGVSFTELKAGKFYRTYSLTRLLKIPYGFIQAFFLLSKLKPDLIFSFGGYLAVPTVTAGFLLGIPSITHEQTVVSGWANKVIAKFAKKVLITWPSSLAFFPKEKCVLTGIPVRKEIFDQSSNSFVFENSLPVLYITGGKTGSHIINKVILENLEVLLTKFNIIHQCGNYSQTNDFEVLNNGYEKIKNRVPGKYYIRSFVLLDEIGEAFAKATVVVARSGAHIVYDLASLKKPCVLIPIPWVSHNEQYENALVLKNAGLAEIIEEQALSGSTFIDTLDYMVSNISIYKDKNNIDFIKTDSVSLIINEILKYRI